MKLSDSHKPLQKNPGKKAFWKNILWNNSLVCFEITSLFPKEQDHCHGGYLPPGIERKWKYCDLETAKINFI